MASRTNLVMANQSDSLRTTVPSHIVRQFDLKAGDQIDWKMVVENNQLTIKVTPSRK